MATPVSMLKDLYWSFFQKFDNKTEFEKELTDYNTRLLKSKPKLDQIIFPETKIVIQFNYAQDMDDEDEDYEEERQVLLETTNTQGFTLSELMFELNNQIVENEDLGIDVSEQDACFFEGFEYLGDEDPDYPQVKVFFMLLGS